MPITGRGPGQVHHRDQSARWGTADAGLDNSVLRPKTSMYFADAKKGDDRAELCGQDGWVAVGACAGWGAPLRAMCWPRGTLGRHPSPSAGFVRPLTIASRLPTGDGLAALGLMGRGPAWIAGILAGSAFPPAAAGRRGGRTPSARRHQLIRGFVPGHRAPQQPPAEAHVELHREKAVRQPGAEGQSVLDVPHAAEPGHQCDPGSGQRSHVHAVAGVAPTSRRSIKRRFGQSREPAPTAPLPRPPRPGCRPTGTSRARSAARSRRSRGPSARR